MYQIKKQKIALIAATASLPILLFFQNCGQTGSIALNGQSSKQSAAAVSTDSLVIDPSSSTPQLPASGTGGTVISDGSGVSMPPVKPPVQLPPVLVEQPPTAQNGNCNSNTKSNLDDDSDDESDDDHSGVEVATGGACKELVRKSKCDVDHNSINNEIGSHTKSKKELDEDCDDDDHDNQSEDKIARDDSCKGLDISDILLNVKSVSANNSKDTSLLIVDENKTISLNKLTLKVKALKSGRIKEVFIQLNADGNKVLSAQNNVMILKTPSAQTAGLKVKLASEISVVVGHTYSIELVIKPADQIVANPNKCIFKPVVKEAYLVSL